MTTPAVRLSVAPIPYYWPRETVFAFYERLAHSPVDIVYLGEVVCSRRHELRASDWLDVATLLRDAGKEVVLSTLVVLEHAADVAAMRRTVQQLEWLVEANDLGALGCAAGRRPFVAGAHLNVYNEATLQRLHAWGAVRWVVSPEMGRTALAHLQRHRPAGLQTEVLAFGRLPLAFSARCFTARHHDLPKDDCQFRCIEHPQGLTVRTREADKFLVINGIQTQSAAVHNLLDAWPDLEELRVDVARLTPMPQHFDACVELFDAVRRHTLEPAKARTALLALLDSADCNGYWFDQAGLLRIEPDHVEPAHAIA